MESEEAIVSSLNFVYPRGRASRTARQFWPFGHVEPEVSEKLKTRFMSCAEGDDEDSARLKRENLRSVLECTDAWTIRGCNECLWAYFRPCFLHGFPSATMFEWLNAPLRIPRHQSSSVFKFKALFGGDWQDPVQVASFLKSIQMKGWIFIDLFSTRMIHEFWLIYKMANKNAKLWKLLMVYNHIKLSL